jgi:hypothetical protein
MPSSTSRKPWKVSADTRGRRSAAAGDPADWKVPRATADSTVPIAASRFSSSERPDRSPDSSEVQATLEAFPRP